MFSLLIFQSVLAARVKRRSRSSIDNFGRHSSSLKSGGAKAGGDLGSMTVRSVGKCIRQCPVPDALTPAARQQSEGMPSGDFGKFVEAESGSLNRKCVLGGTQNSSRPAVASTW